MGLQVWVFTRLATPHKQGAGFKGLVCLLPLSTFYIPQALVDSLTNREIDILDLLAPRLSTKKIAEKLFISTTTVNTNLRNIYRKFKVSKRREAVVKAQALDIFKR